MARPLERREASLDGGLEGVACAGGRDGVLEDGGHCWEGQACGVLFLVLRSRGEVREGWLFLGGRLWYFWEGEFRVLRFFGVFGAVVRAGADFYSPSCVYMLGSADWFVLIVSSFEGHFVECSRQNSIDFP